MASQHFNPKEVCIAMVFALARQLGIFSLSSSLEAFLLWEH
jgi:hypothetical protein